MTDSPHPSHDASPVDWLVIGAGPAGCVLSHRLSADPSQRVVLVEAGEDFKPGQEPWQIKDTFGPSAATDPRFMWPGVQVLWAPHPLREPRRYEQARVIGGGSSVNGLWQSAAWPRTTRRGRERVRPAGAGRTSCRAFAASSVTPTSWATRMARTVEYRSDDIGPRSGRRFAERSVTPPPRRVFRTSPT
jgi:hypothetical protein